MVKYIIADHNTELPVVRACLIHTATVSWYSIPYIIDTYGALASVPVTIIYLQKKIDVRFILKKGVFPTLALDCLY